MLLRSVRAAAIIIAEVFPPLAAKRRRKEFPPVSLTQRVIVREAASKLNGFRPTVCAKAGKLADMLLASQTFPEKEKVCKTLLGRVPSRAGLVADLCAAGLVL